MAYQLQSLCNAVYICKYCLCKWNIKVISRIANFTGDIVHHMCLSEPLLS